MPDQHSDTTTQDPVDSSTSESEDAQGSEVIEAANTAIDERQLWVARDLLTAHVRVERDVEALRLLGEVHHGMGDLPAAGAVWFGAGVKGPEVDAAVVAWRRSHDDDFGAMWRSLPRSVRQEPRSTKVDALRTKALEVREAAASGAAGGVNPAGVDDPAGSGVGSDVAVAGATTGAGSVAGSGSGGFDAAQIIAWVIAALVIVCAVVGLVQILRWMVPGN